VGHQKVKTMQAYVAIGANCEFKLSQAVLVYWAGGGGAFASLHKVSRADDGIPYLAPGEPLTTAFVRTLAQGLGAQVKPEIYPENALARTPDMLVPTLLRYLVGKTHIFNPSSPMQQERSGLRVIIRGQKSA
jgi:hypothetical protein